MKRRSFIIGTGALAMGQLLSGCNNRQQMVLNLQLLQDSIPAQLVGEFRKGLAEPVKLNFELESQLQDLYKRLQTWKQQAQQTEKPSRWSIPFIGRRRTVIASLVTLGDYWLETAIRQNLIQPLELERLSGWQQLPAPWQTLVRRNNQGQIDPSGVVWGAPYRWGTTVIAYNRDKFKKLGWIPKDWSDLWHPELRDRISLLDQPREVIGLTLKKLGFSYNQTDLHQIPNLKSELLALHKQAKLYSSNRYLEPLLLEDTWLAVGWSTDILSLGERNGQIKAIVPQSGTALWADLWVQPDSFRPNTDRGKTTDVSQQWIDFCWRKQPALDISLLTDAASPILINLNSTDLPTEIRENAVLLPHRSTLDKSEFLYPLAKDVSNEYEELWTEIRNS